jgi:chromosome segregation ATPase
VDILEYITESIEDRLARIEYENDELTKQLITIERQYARILGENGRLHAEQEELAARFQAAHENVSEVDDLQERLDEALVVLEDTHEKVCAHSDSCVDFERWDARIRMYMADD